MRHRKLTSTQTLIAALLIVVITFGIVLLGPLTSGHTYRVLPALTVALIISLALLGIGWFIVVGSSRRTVFGLFFLLTGLFILTAPIRIEGRRQEAGVQLQVVNALRDGIQDGEDLPEDEAVADAAQRSGMSEARVRDLLNNIDALSEADTYTTTLLDRAAADLEDASAPTGAFAPDAISTLRYGGGGDAPIEEVPTATWLYFTGVVFVLAGLVGLFLPETIHEWVQFALIILALLVLVPLYLSIMEAVISVLAVGALQAIPGFVWWVLAGAAFLAGIASIAYRNRLREGGASTTWLIASGALLIPTVLIAASVGKQTNVITMLAESLRLATPIVIGAIAGLWSERSGVVNIAIEGTMLTGACFGFVTLFFLGNALGETGLVLFISVMVAVLMGGLIALIHAWLSITFKTNQIISGTVINILAIGVTSFVRREWLLSTEAGRVTLPSIEIPILSQIPLVGSVLFNNKPIFYSMFILLIVTYYVIFHTSWGLRIRAVGEHPHAADTVGINVFRTRYIAVFISGLIAGLGGAWFSLETVGSFDDLMTDGRGFIALAAMIFGKWTPFGAFFGGLLFGFADALGTRFQILEVPIPQQFLQILPFITTIVVLAGLIGRATPPAADGIPYEK